MSNDESRLGYPVDLQYCLRLQQIADTLEEQFRKAQESATDAKNRLFQQIKSGQSTGDHILDMVVIKHSLSRTPMLETLVQRYKELEKLCATHQGELFFAVKARPGIEAQDAFAETFYLGRIDSSYLFCPPDALGLCRFPISKYVRAEFRTFATEYEYGASVEPVLIGESLTNTSLNLACLDDVLTERVAGGKQVFRKLPPKDGELFGEDGKPFKLLEIIIGVDAITEWINDIGTRRSVIYHAMFNMLINS